MSQNKPFGRSLTDFGILLSGEQTLRDACRSGEVASLSKARPEKPTNDNTVRASFVRFLALGGDETAPVHEHGVQLAGAWITEKLDLVGAHVVADLLLRQCHLVDVPQLLGASIQGSLSLSGSHVPGIDSDGAVIKGDVFLDEKFSATGEVRLLGAQIGGNLECRGATLDGNDGDALSADRAVINGNAFLDEKFSATGCVRLLGAQIGGDLSCGSATLDGKDGHALSADGAVINGNAFLDEKFSATGCVRLLGAQIGGDLSCGSATLNGKDGHALSADRAVINGSVFLNEKFSATGEVLLLGAQIGGNLSCRSATLDGNDGNALSADRAVIKGDVFLDKEFSATGCVRLLGAQIGGNLECNGATLDCKDGEALSCDGMSVAGGFFFRNMSTPVKGVSLNHAQVGLLIDDPGSWGSKLVLDGFAYGSIAGGAPTEAAARIAWLDKQSSDHAGLKSAGDNFRPQPWRQLQKVLREMGHLEDARQVAIAFEKRLFCAGIIGQTPSDWGRLRSMIYRTVVRNMHKAFWWLIGYGYRPIRLAAWMLGIWLFCTGIYWYAATQGVFSPNNPLVFQNPAYSACMSDGNPAKLKVSLPITQTQGAGNWYLCADLAEEYTGFSPAAYSLDVLLPLVNLQQEQDWSTLIPTPKASVIDELFAWDLKHFTRLVVWFEILFGWIASLLMVAVVSGLTKRRED